MVTHVFNPSHSYHIYCFFRVVCIGGFNVYFIFYIVFTKVHKLVKITLLFLQ